MDATRPHKVPLDFFQDDFSSAPGMEWGVPCIMVGCNFVCSPRVKPLVTSSLRSKRFRGVSEQKKSEERDFRRFGSETPRKRLLCRLIHK